MPRMDGVSGCSTTCCIRRKPSPRMVCLMPRGQPMKLTTHLIFSVEEFLSDLLSVFFLVGVIVFYESLRGSWLFGPSSTAFSHFRGVLQVQKRIKRRFDHVVRI